MWQDLIGSVRRLSDSELAGRLKELAAGERNATVLLIVHLAELDTRDVHLRAGHGSLFAYCRDDLALSEHEAYNRVAAARAVRRFPVILEGLESGALNLTSVKLLAPHLTAENHRAVLHSAERRSRLQVEEIVASVLPRPDVPSFVRKLPAPRPTSPQPGTTSRPPLTALPGTPSRPPGEVVPLAPDRYKVQVTIGGDTLEKLRLAKDLLRHAVPSGDEAAILDRALTALLDDLAQRKFAAAERPRPSNGAAPGSRHVPADVKRTVFLRDLGRCAFVGTGGRRCGERGFLEFHHLHPHALGGQATPANIQLRCRAHNGYEARVDFGSHLAPDRPRAGGTSGRGP